MHISAAHQFLASLLDLFIKAVFSQLIAQQSGTRFCFQAQKVSHPTPMQSESESECRGEFSHLSYNGTEKIPSVCVSPDSAEVVAWAPADTFPPWKYSASLP